ncbi:hypothetical protein [Pelagicoccus sp. SDUM812003]|uniref:hypothetical protein n=1 Tax=Pelagicoccus sp. SDUM812003 TaxID=3041267 RepID=UPI00280DA580|nr:hypothetical protein [Pelagicoccus sp. SDUM812003]MDQ8203962.1 hypothetical protein [Pelagicoccus sp. SDUM812003]
MKTLLNFITLSILSTSSLLANSYRIELSSGGSQLATMELHIEDGMATSTADGIKEEFDLVNMKWKHEESGQWVSIKQCTEWANQSKAKSMASMESADVPEQVRDFLSWSLSPAFEVTKDGTSISLISGQVDYAIEGIASESNTEDYYKYAILNSYKKAMTERKLPPYSELKAIEEMKGLGYIPTSISIEIPGIPQTPGFEMKIEEI